MTTPNRWRRSGDWISIQGLRIFTKIIGNGPPILVLHGFPTSSFDFSRILPFLSNSYKVILFDYPGFGFSDKPDSEIYSLHKYAEIAQAIVAHFNFKNIFILAHDIGDSIALELLSKKQLKIKGVVLMNGSIVTTPFDEYKMILAQKILLIPRVVKLLNKLGLIDKQFFTFMLQKAFFRPLSPEEIDAFWALFQFNHGDAIYYRLIQYMKERRHYEQPWLNNLEMHTAPLTLIWGQDDPIAPPIIASHMVKLRPDTNNITLKNTAHYPHWESPQKVVSAVTQAFGN